MDDFNPFDPASTHGLWPAMAGLRRDDPVARLSSGVVYVSRHRDARAVLRDAVTFSSEGGFKADGIEIPLGDASIGDFDEPEHRRIRKLAMAAAGPARVEGERDHARRAARALVERVGEARGTVDVVAELALPLASQVIAHLLGAPVEDAGRLFTWAEEIMNSEFTTTLRTERGVGYHGAFPEYAAFVDHLITERLDGASGHDDAIARIVAAIGEDGGEDPAEERDLMFMIVSTLLLGGVVTTRDFIGWMFYELVRDPDLYGAVAADRALVPQAVQEALRLYPPVLYVMRKCTKPTEIAGVELAAGERVLVGLASANRDEDVYDAPDTFRLHRDASVSHLSFGHGIHMCVGNALACMEGEVLLEEFLDRFPVGQVSVPPGFEPELLPVPFIYGPERVLLEIGQ
jgi:cytochrome P450